MAKKKQEEKLPQEQLEQEVQPEVEEVAEEPAPANEFEEKYLAEHDSYLRLAADYDNFRKRTAILSFLRQTKEHPSAEMVFNHLKQEIPDLSLGTVYRNLSMFKAQGEIISLGTVNGIERFDGNTAPHVHFICNHCAGVMDLHGVAVPQELSTAVENGVGGQVNSCQLSFTG